MDEDEVRIAVRIRLQVVLASRGLTTLWAGGRKEILLTGIWPGERIVDKVSRFVDIEESCIDS